MLDAAPAPAAEQYAETWRHKDGTSTTIPISPPPAPQDHVASAPQDVAGLDDERLLDNAATCSQVPDMLLDDYTGEDRPLRECVRLNVIKPYRAALAALTQERDRIARELDRAMAKIDNWAWERDTLLERAEQAERELAEAREDAELGQVLMRFIDRLTDADDSDPLPKIVRELDEAAQPIIDRHRAAIDAARKGDPEQDFFASSGGNALDR